MLFLCYFQQLTPRKRSDFTISYYVHSEPEACVIAFKKDTKPKDRVELASACLPEYNASNGWTRDDVQDCRYWKIRDYTHAYHSKITTPSKVAERFISAIEELSNKKPLAPLLISFDAEDLRKQAAASTERFEEGNPQSILDGIFVAIKDDIDCYPHVSKGGATWFHEVRPIKKDVICISKLRSCGVIIVGKANMHEVGMGVTGNNPNYGYLASIEICCR